jgi:hypothetical protein
VDQLKPTLVFSSAIQVSGGSRYSLFLKNNGLVYSCGSADVKLGFGVIVDMVLVPTLIPSLTNVIHISASTSHTVVMNSCNSSFTGKTCSDPICYGVASTNLNVCSRLGTCVAPNVCVCDIAAHGSNCEIKEYHWYPRSGSWFTLANWGLKLHDRLISAITFPTSTDTVVFDAVGNYTVTIDGPVNIKQVLIGANGAGATIYPVLVVQSTLTVQTVICNVSGVISVQGGTIQAALLQNYGTFNVVGQSVGQVVTTQTLLCDTSGVINIRDGASLQTGFYQNYGILNILGQDTINSLSIAEYGGVGSNINIINTTLITNGKITIGSGSIHSSGTLIGQNMIFDSQDGYFDLLPPYTLKIVGNLTFTSNSTLYINVNGLGTGQTDLLKVNGTLVLDALTLLRVGKDYAPKVDDKVQFLTCTGNCGTKSPQLFLLGAPFKNAIYSFDSAGSGYFQIVFSFGSVDNPNYVCTYLGDKKILELNPIQQKWMLSVTVPMRGSVSTGFGFDLNGTIDMSLLVLSSTTNQVVQYQHNPQITNPKLLLTGSSISQTIFGSWSAPYSIGPSYTTINVIVPSGYLTNQRFIYYAEVPTNATNVTSHFHQRFDYSVLHPNNVPCTNFLQPTRVEVYSMGVTITLSIVYLILIIMCIALSRYRPMNTRGISPTLTLFFLFTQLILETRNYAEISDFQGSLCVYYTFAIYPLQQIVFIMILLYFLRYFAIINLNQNKKNLYTQFAQGNTEVTRLQTAWNVFLKMFTSSWLTFGLVVVAYLISVLLFVLVNIIEKQFICTFTTLIALKYLNNVELIIIYALITITLLSDLIPNWKLILTFRWIQYIFYNDPYFFRAQIIMFLPFMIYSLVIEFVSLAITSTYAQIVKNFGPTIILNTIQVSILLVIDVLFPLTLTIIEVIRSCFRKPVPTAGIEDLLLNTEIESMFVVFSQQEYSVENISCYQDIRTFKKTLKDPMPLYMKYLNGSVSVMECNVQKGPCRVVHEKITSGVIDIHLFDEIERSIVANMCDTWTRFVLADEYVKYIHRGISEKEMIEGK